MHAEPSASQQCKFWGLSRQIKKRPVGAASSKRQGWKGSFQGRRCKLTSRGKRKDAEKLNIVGRGEKVMFLVYGLFWLLIATATHTPKNSFICVNPALQNIALLFSMVYPQL